MGERLNGCVLAVVAGEGVDAQLLSGLRAQLRGRGARVHLLSSGGTSVRAADGTRVAVDADADAVHAAYYDGLVLPGSAVALAQASHEPLLALVRAFYRGLRPVGALGSGVAVVASAGVPSDAEALVVAEAGALETFVARLAADVDAFRRRDGVDETSMASFPASDPAGGGVAI